MKPFAYAGATTIEDVVQALDESCRPFAGGTDLLPLMKKGLAGPERLVNVKTIPGLDAFQRTVDGWHIGALATLARLANSEVAGGDLAVLSQAALVSASPQLRHVATLGGNLLQRPRCWFFRNPLSRCWLKGGERCFAEDPHGSNQRHAVFGAGRCHAVHPSDPAVALLALDAAVQVVGPGGGHTIALADLFRAPRQGAWSEAVLGLDELIVAVTIPAPAARSRGSYVKVAERAVWDFSLVSAAVHLTFEDEDVAAARMVLGGVASAPWRAYEAEAMLLKDGRLTAGAIERAAQAATAGARALSQNGYKVDLIRGVVSEALRKL